MDSVNYSSHTSNSILNTLTLSALCLPVIDVAELRDSKW